MKDKSSENQIIICGTHKGGSGKTTSTINLIGFLLAKKYSLCVVDLDPQKSLTNFINYRNEFDMFTDEHDITFLQNSGNVSRDLLKLKPNYDFIIVDVAGRSSPEFTSAMTVADMLIIPCQCSQFDIETLSSLFIEINNITINNQDLEVVVYQTKANTHSVLKEKHRKEFIDYVLSIGKEGVEFNINILKAINYSRNAYSTAVSGGLFINEANNEKAKAESLAFCDEILNLLKRSK